MDLEGVDEIKILKSLRDINFKEKGPSFVLFQLRTILFGFTAFSI